MSKYTSKHSAGKSGKGKADSSKKTQRILIIVIIAVLAVIIAAALIFIFVPGAESGISGIFGNKGYVPETQDGTNNLTPYYQNGILPTSSDRHEITVIKGGGANGSDFYGKWKMNDHDTYIFDGEGRGIFLAINKNGGIDAQYTFLYSAENGKLGIDYDGANGADFEYDYTIDGDNMTWSRSGNTYTLEKVAEE